MEICSKKDIKFITGVMAASILLGGCTAKGNNHNHELKEDPNAKTSFNLNEVKVTDYDKDEMDKLYREYCFNIFSRTVSDYGSDDNVMISPAFIMMPLDMVAAGAKGESLDQLTNLFAAGQGPLTQQAYASALMDRINEAKEVEFNCANAVWNNGLILGDSVNMDYVGYIQDTFLAQYTVTDFGKDTADEINDWIDEHTNHMIKDAIDTLDADTVMVLVNAICFEGEWAEEYEDSQVSESFFTSADGSSKEAMFLHDTSSAYYETDKATGFIKYYKGGQYAFLAILPTDESISANEFAKNFTAEDYEKFINSVSNDYVVVSKMPEFESDFDIDLNDTIAGLGADSIFAPSTADLSGMAGNPGDIYVSKIIHKTHIEVDRQGTRAAAATIVMETCGCVMEEDVPEYRYVECDRPYAYAIVDVETMAPVFIGTVNSI